MKIVNRWNGLKLEDKIVAIFALLLMVTLITLGHPAIKGVEGLANDKITKPIERNKQNANFEQECEKSVISDNFWNADIEKEVDRCRVFQTEAKQIINELGGENITVTMIPTSNHYCGENAVACAQLGGNEIFIYGDYYFNSKTKNTPKHLDIKRVIAHEYIHTLTSVKEKDVLESKYTKDLENENGSSPVEVVADCGVWNWMEQGETTAYLREGCSPKMIEISKRVINNTLIE